MPRACAKSVLLPASLRRKLQHTALAKALKLETKVELSRTEIWRVLQAIDGDFCPVDLGRLAGLAPLHGVRARHHAT